MNAKEIISESNVDISTLENLRKEKLKIVNQKLIVSFFISLCITILSYFLFGANGWGWLIFIYSLVLLVLFLIFSIILVNKHLNAFVIPFKKDAMLVLFEKSNLEFNFKEQSDYSASQFNSNHIFEQASRFSFTDIFEGKINGKQILFGDGLAQKTETSRNGLRTVTVFQGLYAIIETEINADFSLYVRKDKSWNMSLLQKSHARETKLVKLPNKEFEKKYVVHSTHTEITSKIFTETIQNKILALSEKYKDIVQFNITEGKVHVCHNNFKDNFVISIRKPVIDSLQICLDELKYAVDFLTAFISIIDEIIENKKTNQ